MSKNSQTIVAVLLGFGLIGAGFLYYNGFFSEKIRICGRITMIQPNRDGSEVYFMRFENGQSLVVEHTDNMMPRVGDYVCQKNTLNALKSNNPTEKGSIIDSIIQFNF